MKSQIKHMIVLSFISILVLNIYYLTSIAVMVYYNNYNVKNSNINYDIDKVQIAKPYGDWYPLMNKFSAKGFSNYVNEDVDLFIMYSFGDFNKGTSSIFDSNNKQFNSFYGCYIIESNEEGYFGYDKSGKIQLNKLALVPEYDFKYLVAGNMGLGKEDFFLEYEVEELEESSEGDCVSIKIRTNSIYHYYDGFNANYIQYGFPYLKYERKDFYLIDIYCKMKIEKLENNITVVYYIFSPIKNLVDSWI